MYYGKSYFFKLRRQHVNKNVFLGVSHYCYVELFLLVVITVLNGILNSVFLELFQHLNKFEYGFKLIIYI